MLNKMKEFKEIIAVIIFFITSAFAFDAIYAKDSKVELLAMRLEQKITQDRQNDVQNMIWKLMDRYNCHSEQECFTVMNDYDKDMYRKLLKEYKELEDAKTK